MSAPPHPEFAGLMADILAHPASDTPRLVCADWLEEHGQSQRAEFIRVQCEMELLRLACNCGSCVSRRWGGQHHNGPCALDGREHRHLKAREADILHSFMAPYSEDGVLAGRTRAYFAWAPQLLWGVDVSWVFCRGFVGIVTTRLPSWLQHGATLIRQCPLDRVGLLDCKPSQVIGDYSACWWSDDHYAERDRSLLPADLFDCLPGGMRGNLGLAGRKEYASHGEGMKALSEGCILWAKKQPVPDGGHQEDVPF